MWTTAVMCWSERRLGYAFCSVRLEPFCILQHHFVSIIHFELASFHLSHFLQYGSSLFSACCLVGG
uniref:Uncharacterized protein n=1 Tax=Setaria italica TaxID=4555 RepID=K3Y0P2_SETIT